MGDVDVQREAPVRRIDRGVARPAGKRTGVGHEQVEAAECIGRRRDEGLEGIPVGDVDGLAVRRGAGRAELRTVDSTPSASRAPMATAQPSARGQARSPGRCPASRP